MRERRKPETVPVPDLGWRRAWRISFQAWRARRRGWGTVTFGTGHYRFDPDSGFVWKRVGASRFLLGRGKKP